MPNLVSFHTKVQQKETRNSLSTLRKIPTVLRIAYTTLFQLNVAMKGNKETQSFLDGDVEMIPIATAMNQVAESLRELREQYEFEDGDIQMESAFDYQDDLLQTNQPFRLMVIDTNILIAHLSLIEWLGELLIAARKLRMRSQYRCGLLIPRMVRAE